MGKLALIWNVIVNIKQIIQESLEVKEAVEKALEDKKVTLAESQLALKEVWDVVVLILPMLKKIK